MKTLGIQVKYNGIMTVCYLAFLKILRTKSDLLLCQFYKVNKCTKHTITTTAKMMLYRDINKAQVDIYLVIYITDIVRSY